MMNHTANRCPDKKRFFKPFVGKHYQQGINGKKILVQGASFYCPHRECPLYEQCTNVGRKDSRECDHVCPVYRKAGKALHDEPSHCIEDAPNTYQVFASFIARFLPEKDYSNCWSHLAFTNYVQFFLPVTKHGFRETRWSDISERDFGAFLQTLTEIEPDIIIVWGCVINSRLKEENEFVIDKAFLSATEGYLCHMQAPGMNKKVTIVNPYHPSSSAWYSSLAKFEKYFIQALNE